MKFTLITAVKNSMPFLKTNFDSVDKQTFKNFEHIIVYSNSYDSSLNFIKKKLKKRRKLIIFNTDNVYKAINKGIKKSKGDYILLLHSDDFFFNSKTLSNLNKYIKNNKSDIVYGNIFFVNRKTIKKKIRYWRPGKINKFKIFTGWTIPHTSLVIKRKIFNVLGYYTEKYFISSDYEFILKLFRLNNINISYYDNTIMFMRYGGLSTKLSKMFQKMLEDIQICIKFFNVFGIILFILKILRKVPQFLKV